MTCPRPQVASGQRIYLGVPRLPSGSRTPSVSPHMNWSFGFCLLCLEKQSAETFMLEGHFENMGSQSALRTLLHSAQENSGCNSPILQIGSLRLRELE